MQLQDITNLIELRKYLQMIYNEGGGGVTKDQLKQLPTKLSEIDLAIMEGSLKLNMDELKYPLKTFMVSSTANNLDETKSLSELLAQNGVVFTSDEPSDDGVEMGEVGIKPSTPPKGAGTRPVKIKQAHTTDNASKK